MKIVIQNLCTPDDVCELSVSFDAVGTVVLIDEKEFRASTLLKKLVDIDSDFEGEITLDDVPKSEFFLTHPISATFGYVFDEGIMLSNLSIRENLMLPYRLRWGQDNLAEFDNQVSYWMQEFGLAVDLEMRPAFVKPSLLKMLCLIRSLLLKPQILLIDNPYYLLNQKERNQLLQILSKLKPQMTMLIASIDTDFTDGFAQMQLIFENNYKIIAKSTAIT